MKIEKLVLDAKKTKDNKLINQIINYYEPLFCYNVSRHYGKGYDEKAKNILPTLINYYFEKGLKDKLSGFLRKKSKTVFNCKKNFDQIMHGENSNSIKLHYENKLYKVLCKKCNTMILSDKQLKALAASITKNSYDNYLKTDKQTTVSNYFNIAITRKIDLYKNEEKMLLDYVIRIGVTPRIKVYFYSKYMHVFNEFDTLSLEDYQRVVDNALENYESLHSVIEQNIRNGLNAKKDEEKINGLSALKEVQAGNYENVDKVKTYYSYIIDLVFNNFKDKVIVSEDILKQELTTKYDDYFNAAINSMKKGNNISLQRYINTRLSDYVRRKKSCFNVVYVDAEEKEKNIKDNIKIVDKYAIKYAGTYPLDKMINNLTSVYYSSAEEYYTKTRKCFFDEFVKGRLRQEAKLLSVIYKDDSEDKLTKNLK